MYRTTRYFFPHGIEGEPMDVTWKEWDNLDKAIAYCHRYSKGTRFACVEIEDENGNLLYALSDSGEIIDKTEMIQSSHE